MKFHVDLAGFGQRFVDSRKGECGRVTIAAEMSEHDTLDVSRKELLDHIGGGGVGKMTVPRLNSLFHRPGTMRIALQKFLVVVSFDYQGMNFAQPFHDHLCGVAEVGDESQAAGAGVKSEPDRIDRVVRYRKSLHDNVADREFAAGAKNPPITMSIQPAVALDGFCGEGVAINGNVEFAAENFEPADMVAVLMGEENAVQPVRRHTALSKAQDYLPGAQSSIDKNFAVISRDKRAVPGTATAEHGQTEHVLYLDAICLFPQTEFAKRRDLSSPIGQRQNAQLLARVIE